MQTSFLSHKKAEVVTHPVKQWGKGNATHQLVSPQVIADVIGVSNM